ncbi:acyl carrier protein [Paenibacillus oleatilyticus]|uniref:acyl carrier protein n=1 Tax=Paenibacillus oleatilyticus TaxID=2594886 RepID=UPI001C1F95C8|nr:acyl carrier protein [Paenibacillus oleatilyticus]MBU7316800.1 acyl carrier protein [Paenibacillus oleatilyticus]
MERNQEALKRRLVELAFEITGEGELGEDQDYDVYLTSPLPELGVDSLTALELAVHLEREFGTRLEEQELTQIRTLEDIVRFVEAKGD